MKKPSDDDFELAAEWLNYNTGDDGEKECCHRVAAWLREQIFSRQVRRAARNAGFPVSKLREAMARKSGRTC